MMRPKFKGRILAWFALLLTNSVRAQKKTLIPMSDVIGYT